jgi:hypothetical protein
MPPFRLHRISKNPFSWGGPLQELVNILARILAKAFSVNKAKNAKKGGMGKTARRVNLL